MMFRPLLMLSCGSVEVSHGKIRVRLYNKPVISRFARGGQRGELSSYDAKLSFRNAIRIICDGEELADAEYRELAIQKLIEL